MREGVDPCGGAERSEHRLARSGHVGGRDRRREIGDGGEGVACQLRADGVLVGAEGVAEIGEGAEGRRDVGFEAAFEDGLKGSERRWCVGVQARLG